MFVRPSRRVPGTVKLGLIIGGRATFFGWLLIGLGMCFVWSYGGTICCATGRFDNTARFFCCYLHPDNRCDLSALGHAEGSERLLSLSTWHVDFRDADRKDADAGNGP